MDLPGIFMGKFLFFIALAFSPCNFTSLLKILLQLLLLLTLFSCNTFNTSTSEKEAETGPINELQLFPSKYLDNDISYQVVLPESFNARKDSLNLLVLLDGDDYLGLAKDVTSLFETGGKIMPTLIISLPSTMESRWAHYTPTNDTVTVEEGYKELYARTGRFPEFADFVGMELIPFVKQKYNIDFKKKTIFGHSLGGLGVLSFAVLRPEIFDNYIAASPSTMFDSHYIFRTLEKKSPLDFKSMFLTAAINDGQGYRANVEWLKDYLDEHKEEDQAVEMRIYEQENHTTSGLRSLIDGLNFVAEQW